jgi:hypothetical protein
MGFMEIVLIGSGNTATVLGWKLKRAGHHILQVYSQNAEHASELAGKLDTEFISASDHINHNADLYLMAISDQALMDKKNQFGFGRKLTVHTAGSVPMNALSRFTLNYGVLYPLQSLRKEIPDVKEIPFLIDGNTNENLTLIQDLAHSLSNLVSRADDIARMKIHLSAVIVNNFSNHLYALAEEFCIKENIRFELLQPLMRESIKRLESNSPKQMQTGPAIRSDQFTIDKHLEMLDHYPSLQNLYQFISKNIQENLNLYAKQFPKSGI